MLSMSENLNADVYARAAKIVAEWGTECAAKEAVYQQLESVLKGENEKLLADLVNVAINEYKKEGEAFFISSSVGEFKTLTEKERRIHKAVIRKVVTELNDIAVKDAMLKILQRADDV